MATVTKMFAWSVLKIEHNTIVSWSKLVLKNKRNKFSISDKSNPIMEFDRRSAVCKVNVSKHALEHDLPVLTIQTILRKRQMILEGKDKGHFLGRKKLKS